MKVDNPFVLINNIDTYSKDFTGGPLNSLDIFASPGGGSRLVGSIPAAMTMTVLEISDENPNWVRLEYDGKKGWANISLVSYDENGKPMPIVIPRTDEDGYKMSDAYADIQFLKPELSGVYDPFWYHADEMLSDTETYNDSQYVISQDEEIVTYKTRGTLSDAYQRYIKRSVKAYGAPPQWTEFVDPRIYSISSSVAVQNQIKLGRRYADTMVSNPTIISLCPGIIKFNSVISQMIESSFSVGDSFFQDPSNLGSSGQIVEFEPSWRKAGSNPNGYISYVNTLCTAMAVATARADEDLTTDGESRKLTDLPFPGSGTEYHKYDWAEYDNDTDNKQTIFSHSFEYHYINFFGVGQNNVRDDFSTDVRSSSLEDMIEGAVGSTLREVSFFTGGLIGNYAEADLSKWTQEMANLGSLGKLLANATEFIKGGHLIFPKVIDDCTYGKSMTFTSRFVSTSGDQEDRFLNVLVPLAHLLPFVLPRQAPGLIDMYTTPFICRAFAKGLFSCPIGVVTNFQITKGGADDTAWTGNGEPTEIEVSFDITPLYNKLMISSDQNLSTWFNRNEGMMEYITSLCGVDMRTSQLGLKMAYSVAFAQRGVLDRARSTIAAFYENSGVNSILSFFN